MSSVTHVPATNNCDWVFSDNVTKTGVPANLQVNVGSGLENPSAASQVNAFTLRLTYSDSAGAGNAWSIPAAPTNITQADNIAIPQSGVTL